MNDSKLYIAVLDEFPDYMVPTLVAHSVLAAHLKFSVQHYGFDVYQRYVEWLEKSFKKCVVRVNRKEFDKIAALPNVHLGHEKNTLGGNPSCVVVCPLPNENLPNVLKFAKLWAPKHQLKTDLVWSEEYEPNKILRYNHVIAQTPLGNIILEWKGWKEDDTICGQMPWVTDGIIPFVYGNTLKEAKENAQKLWNEKMKELKSY